MNNLAGFALFVAIINEMQTPCDLPIVWWESGQEKTDTFTASRRVTTPARS